MQVKKALEEIVGAEFVFDEPEALKAYSRDYSLEPQGIPNYVVQPKNTEEIQKVIKLANESRIPVIASSSTVHFYGSTIPKQGGIVLDLRRMNKILKVDELNRRAIIEPGVNWEQLQGELSKYNFMVMSPLLPHPKRSVLTSYLEREAFLNPRWEYGDPLQSMEVVWGNGDIFRTGSASVPGYPESLSEGVLPQGPGTIDFYRLIQGSQGTMGVVAWASIKVEHLPRVNKTFFIPVNRVEDIIDFIYRIQKRRIGYECFLLDRLNLATILTEKWPEDFNNLRKTLPLWTLILILSGTIRRPEERVGYEEEALREINKGEFPSLQLLTALPGAPGMERRLPGMLRQPWLEEAYWKFRYKGACQELFFITTLERAPEFIKVVDSSASKYGFDLADIGHYVQPIDFGASCHCEFNFYYDPKDLAGVERIKKLYPEIAQGLINLGALFTRPYGVLAELVYNRATSYTLALKKVKSIFDPNNILCPGNLCF